MVHQFQRLQLPAREVVRCAVDDMPLEVFAGDTVLTAVLTHRRNLRPFEFADAARAGFCLMGACQDCWVHLETGERVRACSTQVVEGMRIATNLGRCFHAK
ncbi:(2Fe-2S)-binding protein [Mesorhizobium sp. M0520]